MSGRGEVQPGEGATVAAGPNAARVPMAIPPPKPGIPPEKTLEERGGFEPPVVFSYSRFPGVCLKPLSHLSTAGIQGAKAAAVTQQDFGRNWNGDRNASGGSARRQTPPGPS